MLLMSVYFTDLLESKVLGVVSNDISGNITVSYIALLSQLHSILGITR